MKKIFQFLKDNKTKVGLVIIAISGIILKYSDNAFINELLRTFIKISGDLLASISFI